MLCDKCNKNEATIHLTQAVDDKVSKFHLCASCAEKAGIDVQQTMSVTDVLLGLEEQQSGDAGEAPSVDLMCSECGLSRHEYKKRGRLGCPSCYVAFQKDLESLIKAMQRSNRHVGKEPKTHGCGENDPQSLRELGTALKAAIDNEQFEEAARLRDLISEVSQQAEQG